MSSLMSWMETPNHPRTTLPLVLRSSRMSLAMFTGMANPMPCPWATMAVLIPTPPRPG
jgi:hypothetical protein